MALRWGHNQQEQVPRFFFCVNFNLKYFNMNFPIKILAFAEENAGELYSCFILFSVFFCYRHNFFCSSMMLNF